MRHSCPEVNTKIFEYVIRYTERILEVRMRMEEVFFGNGFVWFICEGMLVICVGFMFKEEEKEVKCNYFLILSTRIVKSIQ